MNDVDRRLDALEKQVRRIGRLATTTADNRISESAELQNVLQETLRVTETVREAIDNLSHRVMLLEQRNHDLP